MADYDFIIKSKLFNFSFDRKFNIFDASEHLIGVCSQKAFKLKEDIRVFSDDTMKKEIIRIQALDIIDFNARYNVYDSDTNTLLGTWERKGGKSIFRDTWSLLDAESAKEIAKMEEDNMTLALIRRISKNISLFFPQSYFLKNTQGLTLASYVQTFNPFLYGLKVSIFKQPNAPHPKLAMAGAMLLSTIEGRQE